MSLTARDVMQSDVKVVTPETTLPELERAFLQHHVTGFPVVDDGQLVGIVSRSDVIRQLCVEQSLAEMVTDYYREAHAFQDSPRALTEIGDHVGERLENLHVRDVMSTHLLTVRVEQPLTDIARMMLGHHIHRVPVVSEGGQLVGLLTTSDFVRLFATERVRPVF